MGFVFCAVLYSDCPLQSIHKCAFFREWLLLSRAYTRTTCTCSSILLNKADPHRTVLWPVSGMCSAPLDCKQRKGGSGACGAVLAIAYVPHTLLGSALSLLLVFRTNSSYGRLVEGRRVRHTCLLMPSPRSSHWLKALACSCAELVTARESAVTSTVCCSVRRHVKGVGTSIGGSLAFLRGVCSGSRAKA